MWAYGPCARRHMHGYASTDVYSALPVNAKRKEKSAFVACALHEHMIWFIIKNCDWMIVAKLYIELLY